MCPAGAPPASQLVVGRCSPQSRGSAARLPATAPQATCSTEWHLTCAAKSISDSDGGPSWKLLEHCQPPSHMGQQENHEGERVSECRPPGELCSDFLPLPLVLGRLLSMFKSVSMPSKGPTSAALQSCGKSGGHCSPGFLSLPWRAANALALAWSQARGVCSHQPLHALGRSRPIPPRTAVCPGRLSAGMLIMNFKVHQIMWGWGVQKLTSKPALKPPPVTEGTLVTVLSDLSPQAGDRHINDSRRLCGFYDAVALSPTVTSCFSFPALR